MLAGLANTGLINIKNMGVIDLILHLAGFVAPAFFVALAVAFSGGLFFGKKLAWRVFFRRLWVQWAVNFAVGLTALIAGLVTTSSDGRMLTYAALVLAVATSQLLLSRKS